MKTFTQFNEGVCVTADINPGNNLKNTLGVMNHYTPIDNIVTNVRNLFAPLMGCVVCVGEDGVSLKMHSTKFVNKSEIDRMLNMPMYNGISTKTYIMQQGLDFIKMVNIGQYWVVYFCPRDIPTATTAVNPQPACGNECPTCHDCGPCEANDYEVNIYYSGDSINEGGDDDVEKKDITKDKIKEILGMKDKVKAAKQLTLVVANEIELPREYYFAVVRSDQGKGEESIALRWKYTVPQPHGKSAERTRSLINIYGFGDEAVWVQDFAEDALFNLPKEVRTLIEHILEILNAEENSSKKPKGCVYKIEDEDKKDDKKKDKKDNKKEEKKDNKDDDESEDDDSRGDKTDDLLG